LVLGLACRRVFGVHGEIDKPAAGLTGDRGREDFASQAQRLPHPYPATGWDAYAGTYDADRAVAEGEAVVNSFLAEFRVVGAARGEVPEPLAQLDDCHLRGVLGDFEHPRERLALDGVQLAA
jgi:hypothetical protein